MVLELGNTVGDTLGIELGTSISVELGCTELDKVGDVDCKAEGVSETEFAVGVRVGERVGVVVGVPETYTVFTCEGVRAAM